MYTIASATTREVSYVALAVIPSTVLTSRGVKSGSVVNMAIWSCRLHAILTNHNLFFKLFPPSRLCLWQQLAVVVNKLDIGGANTACDANTRCARRTGTD